MCNAVSESSFRVCGRGHAWREACRAHVSFRVPSLHRHLWLRCARAECAAEQDNAALTCVPLTQVRMTEFWSYPAQDGRRGTDSGLRVTCEVRARDACVNDKSENIIVKPIKEILSATCSCDNQQCETGKSLDIRVVQFTACVCTSRACVLVYSHSVLTPPPKEDLT